jgi:serine/threonine-protein kinase
MPADTPRAKRPGRSKAIRLRSSQPARLGLRVWSAGRWVLILAALGATFGTFFLASMRIATRAREVEVPDLHALSVEAATLALSTVGLGVRIDPLSRPDATVPADHVMSQEPEAGSVLRRQRSVRIRLSEGLRDPTSPTIVGQAERAAEIALLEAGIEIAARSEVRSADYGTGSVVAQDPPAGARASGVSLLVNRGEAGLSFVMPDVIGAVGVQAVSVLRAQGFRVTITAEVPYPGLPRGIVVRQTPQAGFQITLDGAPIALEVSR